ncbi:MAG TPA: aldehyde dehydrogenase family protein [Solirubrobacteraceae bacterium]|jgi:acyl-CoA reductase-like NAD-dependent aldehyde dehydrogenase|nr:aldehyde dehydrogenase family protein [Solirubrobacteraceae bacterium]
MAISEAVTTPLVINGEDRSTAESFAVYDPHDGSVVGYAAAATTQDALDAVAAAERAWPAWAALTAAERIDICLAALETLPNDLPERAGVLSRENGKIRFEAEIDLMVFAGRFHEAAKYARELDAVETIAGPPYNTTIQHLPQGVVTIIYPFNWPLAILAASLPHALMAGNTVIAKPPPTAPLSSVLTLRHVAQKLPPGVLNVVTGQDAVLGSVVIGDPRIKHVAFTGSTAGGKRIMEMASKNVTNVTLELGGNDPAVILEDAVLDEGTIAKIGMATFMTTGQVCMAIKRLYVPNRLYDQAIDGLRAFIEGQKIGAGLNPDVTMGPLNMKRQRDYVEELLAESRAKGTEVIDGGEFVDADPSEGNYMKPALVLDPSADERIVNEEQFGPALPIIAYDTEEEAVRLANDTWAGLCASVWSSDNEHAMKVGRRLRAGHVFFNNHNATAVDERAMFGGFNQSGIGRELGREGVLGFTETQVLAVPGGEQAH